MRKFAIAAVLPILLAACASQPPKKLAGSYAVVLDPELDSRDALRGQPLLHQAVRASLTRRLELAPAVAEADTVIVLKPSRATDRLPYEIRRGDKVVLSSFATVPLIRPGGQRTIGEQLEPYANSTHVDMSSTVDNPDARDAGNTWPRSRPALERAQHEAIAKAGNQIAAAILQELSRL
jgi:hypothetical protein